MKKKFIHISCIIIIIGSLASWKYLFPKILNFHKNSIAKVFHSTKEEPIASAPVEQKVAPEETNEKISGDKTSSPLNQGLYDSNPDAPIKKGNPGEVYMRAKSAIAIDAETGTILHYQDGKKRTAIASLTKMMTAVLVMENIQDLDHEIITVDKESIYVEGTVVGCPRSGYCISTRLQPGEKIAAINLLKAMLMNSTNDAAYVLGRHIAGSKDEFANMMNRKAEELGLSDTHFCNPSGLDEDDKPGQCYSTAYDLARIAAFSMKYPLIWEIMRLPDMDIQSADGKFTHQIINTDELLDQMPNCMGGKTGFTYEAGKSLMMAAHDPKNKNHRVVAVVIDDPYRWEDMKVLFNWVFDAYDWPQKKK